MWVSSAWVAHAHDLTEVARPSAPIFHKTARPFRTRVRCEREFLALCGGVRFARTRLPVSGNDSLIARMSRQEWHGGLSGATPLAPTRGQSRTRSREPASVLYVCHACPVPARLGPARRHYHLLQQLTRFYDVHVVTLADEAEREAFAATFGDRVARFHVAPRQETRPWKFLRKSYRTLNAQCDFLPAVHPGLRRLCAEVTSRRAYDAIVLSSVLLRALPLPHGTAIVGDTHNVEFDLLRRTATGADITIVRRYAGRQWPAMRAEEERCGRQCDLVVATCERDRQIFAEELGLERLAIIPNGIDLAEFMPSRPAPGGTTILFAGLMSYYPNQQAVRWFLNEVFPLIRRKVGDAKFVVAGATPPRWLRAIAADGVQVTGWVPDIRPYLDQAAVVVVPLSIGGGTRVKILEAQAMGRPVVTRRWARRDLTSATAARCCLPTVRARSPNAWSSS